MRSHQTTFRRKDGALAVAFYRTALEHEVQMVFICAFHEALLEEMTVNLIVERSLELLAPAVEAEVEQQQATILFHRDEPVVASPSVVGI